MKNELALMLGTAGNRKEALIDLELYQKNDFIELFNLLGSLPVTIRLLDPPLHF